MFYVIIIVVLLAVLLDRTAGKKDNTVEYENAESYAQGSAVINDAVRAIDIDWVCGSVNIDKDARSGISLSETAAFDVTDEMRMSWRAEGGVLKIKFCAAGVKLPNNTPRKDLTVMLPEGLCLDDLTVSTASADINVGEIKTRNLRADVASGRIYLGCEVDSVSLDSASGGINAMLPSKPESLNIKSASGDVSVTSEGVRKLDIGAASGSVWCDLDTVPESAKIDTASGDVTVILPENAGFRMNVDTASGKINSGFSLLQDGKTYVSGAPRGYLDINTASGDIEIRTKQ